MKKSIVTLSITMAIILAGIIASIYGLVLTSSSSVDATPTTEIIDTMESMEPAPSETIIFSTEPMVEPDTTLPADACIVDPNEIAPNGMTNRELLACVIYQEAGWDLSCDSCRLYVADVVLNRILSPYFPDTLYGVLTDEGQYGNYCWTGVKWSENATNDPRGVARAYTVADRIFSGEHSELYEKNYIWQAEFTQGAGGFWCCDTYYGYS